jgi:hypothetical protein
MHKKSAGEKLKTPIATMLSIRSSIAYSNLILGLFSVRRSILENKVVLMYILPANGKIICLCC